MNESKKPLFSIIIPVYNRETVVERAINAILSQSFDDWELILVNDGSTDNSLSVLTSCAEKDNRISVINKPNGGVSSARNAGIKKAIGEYVLFCDSDDTFAPNAFTTLVDYINKFGKIDMFAFCLAKISLFDVHYIKGYEFNKILNKDYIYNTIIPNILNLSPSCLNYSFLPQCFLKVFKNKILKEKNLLFDEKLKTWEDNFFNVCYLRHINSLVLIDKALYIGLDAPGEHLSSFHFIDTIQKLPYKFSILKSYFGDMYDFNNEYICTWYFKTINTQINKILKVKEDDKKLSTIKAFLKNEIVINWFTKAKKESFFEKIVSKAVINKKVNKACFYYKLFYFFSLLKSFLSKIKYKTTCFLKIK